MYYALIKYLSLSVAKTGLIYVTHSQVMLHVCLIAYQAELSLEINHLAWSFQFKFK